MLDLTLITVGKVKDSNLAKISADYLKRIKPFMRLEVIEVKAEAFSAGSKEKAKREEGKRIEEVLSKITGANIFLLAEDGVELNSVNLARRLEKINAPITLVLAGALGWEENLRKKYQQISLSKLTMPHELARVVLLEQLYRSALILNNKEYHY